jgi:hypothetical protein
MSTNILEQLKKKPVPKKFDQIKIKIKQPNQQEKIKLKTKIVDKTKDFKLSRDEFLKTFNQLLTVQTAPKIKDIVSIKESDSINDSDSINKMKLEEIKETIQTPSKKIKKLPKKFKLKIVEDKSNLEEIDEIKPIRARKTIKPDIELISDNIDQDLILNGIKISDRLPPPEKKILFRANAYYMDNREIFVNFINALFKPYKEEFSKMENIISCDRPKDAKFSLLTHQKLVRDYLNLYTPYRGLLLYHGLGSGKTCSSIAIAEGLKSDKQVIIMTPASLRMNYLQELKNCGDMFFKLIQYWEFITLPDNSDANYETILNTLSGVLNISKEYIKRKGGAWLVNVKKSSNYDELTAEQKNGLEQQLNEMITYKYKFINYNGLRKSHLKQLTQDYKINPFDNKVIVIDEAHNFVSLIVNKLKKPDSLNIKLYEYLMSAENCKIVLLSGTPIINYPNEISIMFNILRGYIKSWSFSLNIKKATKLNKSEMINIFKDFNILDTIDYKPSTKILTVTRNPFGFININKDGTYKGVSNFKVKNKGNINDEDFVKILSSILKNKDIEIVPSSIKINTYKALPDDLDTFKKYFIDANGKIINTNLFKRRILGLTSYFRSAQEKLMPTYNKDTDFKVVKIPMSDYQFGVYEQARIEERKLDRANRKKKIMQVDGLYEDTVSTYRIFSRAFCNFVFPPENPRPMPSKDKDISTIDLNNTNEDVLDAVTIQEKIENPDGQYASDEIEELEKEKLEVQDKTYEIRIDEALNYLVQHANKYFSPKGLEIYSPKFLNILENIQDPEFKGLHLIYSQFRTLEGIGILKLIFEHNGFAQFKIKKDEKGIWQVNIPKEKMGLPCFALYTGTEDVEEKEILRNIFNSDWNKVPDSIVSSLSLISTNNFYGEIIKVLMITSSGAEGISLKNTRYVHIVESYWHPVRTQQVIGRARRICSHQDLPPALRTVQVFLYLMTFTEEQLAGENAVELKLKDGSKLNDKIPLTSDEALYEIATIKEKISNQVLKSVKESSIDCAIYNKPGTIENLKCFTFGKTNPSSLSFQPSISNEEKDTLAQENKRKITWKAEEITLPIDGVKKKFALNKSTMEVYDFESYKEAIEFGTDPILIGKLIKKDDGKYKFVKL